MVVKAVVSSVEGTRYRVAIGGQISAPLPRLELAPVDHQDYPLAPGDIVLVKFLSVGYGNGVILGRIME